VAARDDDAGLGGGVRATFEDARDDPEIHVTGERGDIQGKERLRAHREDVAERVGCGDRAIQVRIVNDRREEIDGLDDGALVVELEDRRVITRLKPDDDARIGALC
jgi:hypothetical protein